MILTCSFSFIPSSSWLSASNCFFNTSKQTVTREETVREWKWIFSKLIYSTFSYFLEVYLTNIGWETLFSAVLFKHDNKTFLFSCNLDNRDYHEVVILQVEYVATVHVLFHCIVLYCIVLYCIVFYCIVLYCTLLLYTVLVLVPENKWGNGMDCLKWALAVHSQPILFIRYYRSLYYTPHARATHLLLFSIFWLSHCLLDLAL